MFERVPHRKRCGRTPSERTDDAEPGEISARRTMAGSQHRSAPGTTWAGGTVTDTSYFYHSEDDQYWYKYTFSVAFRDHPNPTTPDGYWYPSPSYVDSAHFICD